MTLYPLARRALFTLPPGPAQAFADTALATLGATAAGRAGLRALTRGTDDRRLASRIAGVPVANPIGVAGGVDKNARLHRALHALGFGHVEVGTVTPRPQAPNPGQILWRAPGDKAIVNAMGFPNDGAAATAPRLASRDGVLGVNIGPNRDRLGDVAGEVDALVPALAPLGDYVALNLSSPNTKGLRDLADPARIARLVGHTVALIDDHGGAPLLVKASPDNDDDVLAAQCRAAIDAGAAGIIATNTTITRPAHLAHLDKGGLSGEPLRQKALAACRVVRGAVGDEATVVGVGGISTGEDVLERMAAGADVVQAYTGFVYRGPGFPSLVCREVLAGLDKRGLDKVAEIRD